MRRLCDEVGRLAKITFVFRGYLDSSLIRSPAGRGSAIHQAASA